MRRKFVGFLLHEQGKKLVELGWNKFPQVFGIDFGFDRIIQELVDRPDSDYKVLKAFLSGNGMEARSGDEAIL